MFQFFWLRRRLHYSSSYLWERRRMVLTSFSVIPYASSFPSISDLDSPSTSTPTRIRTIHSSRRCLEYTRPLFQFSSLYTYLPFPLIVRAFSKQAIEDESADKFLQTASLAGFVRFKQGIDGYSGELQTAIVSYRSLLHPFLQVDLVSTIHIADKEYFTALQKVLESYDCVLYEMVASRKSIESRRNTIRKVRLRGSRTNFINILACICRWTARILKVDFQLDSLSYQAENWYHADLDYETFKLLQLKKGESMFKYARDMALRSIKATSQPASSVLEDLDSDALSNLEFAAAIKFFLAKILSTELTEVITDVEDKSVIIGERNKAAVDSLRKAIPEGHNRIAILYGAAHMPDLGRRLREQFHVDPHHVQWITAWSIKKRKLNTRSFPFLNAMAAFLSKYYKQ